jgi:hypothetical protein
MVGKYSFGRTVAFGTCPLSCDEFVAAYAERNNHGSSAGCLQQRYRMHLIGEMHKLRIAFANTRPIQYLAPLLCPSETDGGVCGHGSVSVRLLGPRLLPRKISGADKEVPVRCASGVICGTPAKIELVGDRGGAERITY